MNLEEAKAILRAHGKPTCSCKWNNDTYLMIQEAIKLKNIQSQNS